MSGPKVVRVVTRQELVAAGESLLSRLSMALADWQRACEVFNGATAADVKLATLRRQELEQLLRSDKFADFGRAATAEIDFLESDAARRREMAAQAAAAERARQTSGRQIAQVLLRANASISADARKELERASRGELSVVELDRVLSQVTGALHRAEGSILSDAQKQLSKRLGEGQSQSVEEWSAQRAKIDGRLQDLHAGIAELEFLGGTSDAADFLRKLEETQLILDHAERSMRLDSLQILVQRAKFSAVERANLLKRARALLAECAHFELSASAEKLSALNASTNVHGLERVLKEAHSELERARSNHAAASKRKVVLEGLAQLGYTVHDGLSTATSEAGRLIVRSPDRPGYGVELLSSDDAARLQVRSVAFDGGRDAAQDVKEEQTWCSDFGKLNTALKAQGCEVVVEKALGVGKVALKLVVGVDAAVGQRRTTAPAIKKASS